MCSCSHFLYITVASYVCCVFDTWVNCTETAESIQMVFGEQSHVGQRNPVLDGGLVTEWERNFEGRAGPLWSIETLWLCTKLVSPLVFLPFYYFMTQLHFCFSGSDLAVNIIMMITLFMVLSSWPKSLREFTRFIWWMQTERRMAANPQTKPIHLGCYRPHPLSPLFPLLSPRRVEGLVDLGTTVNVRSPCPRLYIAEAVAVNKTIHGVIQTWVLSHRSQTC